MPAAWCLVVGAWCLVPRGGECVSPCLSHAVLFYRDELIYSLTISGMDSFYHPQFRDDREVKKHVQGHTVKSCQNLDSA